MPQAARGGGISGERATSRRCCATEKKRRGAFGRGGIWMAGGSTASNLAIAMGVCFFCSSCRTCFTVWQSWQGCLPSNVLATATVSESCCE